MRIRHTQKRPCPLTDSVKTDLPASFHISWALPHKANDMIRCKEQDNEIKVTLNLLKKKSVYLNARCKWYTSKEGKSYTSSKGEKKFKIKLGGKKTAENYIKEYTF